MSARTFSGKRSRERFAARQRTRRRRLIIAFSVLAALLLGALIWGLWQKPVRIDRVTIYGADQSFAALAERAMQGTIFGVLPANSTIFIPTERIREAIMTAYPWVAAVSFFHDGLSGLSIKIDTRVPVARWCADMNTSAPCYVFDAGGFVYATATPDVQPLNAFTLYGALAATSSPVIGTVLTHEKRFPSLFDFARQLSHFGSSVTHILLRGDEVDDYLANGARVTYVLGEEQQAFTALTSAGSNFNLANDSVEYIDLRFPGKVYLKKK